CDHAVLTLDQRHQHKLLAPKLGCNPQRNPRMDSIRGLRRQTRASADHRCNECVKGKNRRRWKSGQYSDRLASNYGEAEWFARLERDTVHQDPRFAELQHNAM